VLTISFKKCSNIFQIAYSRVKIKDEGVFLSLMITSYEETKSTSSWNNWTRAKREYREQFELTNCCPQISPLKFMDLLASFTLSDCTYNLETHFSFYGQQLCILSLRINVNANSWV
jgi:hypothetical protein